MKKIFVNNNGMIRCTTPINLIEIRTRIGVLLAQYGGTMTIGQRWVCPVCRKSFENIEQNILPSLVQAHRKNCKSTDGKTMIICEVCQKNTPAKNAENMILDRCVCDNCIIDPETILEKIMRWS